MFDMIDNDMIINEFGDKFWTQNLTVGCYEINLLLRHFHAVFRVIQTWFDDLNLFNHSDSSTTSFYTDKLDCI